MIAYFVDTQAAEQDYMKKDVSLHFRVSTRRHKILKAQAASREMTMTQYIENLLDEAHKQNPLDLEAENHDKPV